MNCTSCGKEIGKSSIGLCYKCLDWVIKTTGDRPDRKGIVDSEPAGSGHLVVSE